MKADRLEELLVSYEEDTLSPGEKNELATLLSASPEARRRLVEAGWIRQFAAGHFTGTEPEPVVQPRESRASWWQWRPVAAAAAGVLVGIFGSGLVVGQGGTVKRFLLPLANPGFETNEELPQVNLVPFPDQWSGLDTEIVEGGAERPGPRTGRRMLRLGPAPEGRGYFASVMADLEESRPNTFGQLTRIEVTAHFHASEPGNGEHYLLAASTYAETPSEVPALWDSNWRTMITAALSSTHRSIFPTASETGWQTITVPIEVPPGARTLVVTLGSNTPGPVSGRTDHYMDDVEASWLVIDDSSTSLSTP